MKKFIYTLIITISSIGYVNADETISLIKQRYVDILLASDIQDRNSDFIRSLDLLPADNELSDRCIVELYQRKSITPQDITQILSTLQTDGSWSDINYQDKTRSGWKVKEHVERIFPMCRYYKVLVENKQDKKAKELLNTIVKTIQWWTEHNPISPNWWHNQVGIPKTFGSALLLVWEELPLKVQKEVIETVFDQHVKFGMTGQNKVWKAGNMLIRALLTNNEEMLITARNTIASEIETGNKEGIQPDWSYHQHGSQQQFGNYGLAYLSTMCLYFDLFRDTRLEFDDEQKSILTHLLEEGYGWVIWNKYLDVNCLNRQLFKNAASCKYLIIQFCARSLKGENLKSPIGNKHFPYSDMTVHHTKEWMASVKMASNRVIGTEQINGDNQQGYYLADGATYVYTHGNEYENIFPLWDWRKIPGTTCYQSNQKVPQEKTKIDRRNHTDFVGGISKEMFGITAMELNRNNLHAKKMWVFTPNCMICLGAGIKTDSLPVATTIEQCNADKKDRWIECQTGRFILKDKGYILLDGQNAVHSIDDRTGNWKDVMLTYKPCIVKGKVATLYIDHGMAKDASYEYIIVPKSTPKSLKNFKTNEIKILANNSDMQIIEYQNKIFAVVYNLNKKKLRVLNLKVDICQTGIYLAEKEKDQWKITYKNPIVKQ